MSTKYLHRTIAQKCPIHQAVKDTAIDLIMEKSFFSKEEILEKTNFKAVESAIRWDYVREFIENDEKVELIPLTERFFKWRLTKTERDSGIPSNKNEAINKVPEKFIAGGNGRRTFGYLMADSTYPSITIAKMATRRSHRNGVAKAFDGYLHAVKAKVSLQDSGESLRLVDKLDKA